MHVHYFIRYIYDVIIILIKIDGPYRNGSIYR